ncbi:MAG TPA: spermine synthase [Rhodanobacteraceae bacterium]|nr:spermine synthase [Rhodanobacteraceae bacterium]
MQSSPVQSRWLGPAALAIFALSGLSGLIYQSIWSQYLGLYLGHAAYAQSLVLAIFMGGMAAGAWWASRRSLGWTNLLRAYSYVELVIGLAAVLFHPIYQAATGFAYDVAFPAMPGAWAVQAFKWFSGALLILPQSILLGMTFPLMSNGLMRRLDIGDGAILSGLYFTNSIGAAVGALVATFVLLPTVGLPGAMRFGGLVNVLVALFAFLISRQGAPASSTPASAGARSGERQRLLLAAAFVTGATSFVYEIGWVRMLSMALGTTVHAFELMLTAFIGGLAFGGLWIRRRIDGYAEPVRAGGHVQVLMGLAALVSLWLYMHSFDWVGWFLRALSPTDAGYSVYNAVSATVAILIMAPTAFFAGMTLPLFTLSLLRSGGGEASVGRIYAANTLGAIVGVIAAVHVLVPMLGLKLAMIAAAVGDLALGVVLLQRAGGISHMKVPAVVSTVATLATIAFVHFDTAVMTAGVFRTGVVSIDRERGEKVVYYRDGKTASIGVIGFDTTRSIETNGKPDASIELAQDKQPRLDEYTMSLAAILPLALHEGPAREVANIGFGSGLTTHTLLGDARVASVDSVEIERAMYEGAREFRPAVERAYTDPRARIHIEDARTFFASHQARYDVIVSEPSNPWVSGVASLFSAEFYRFIPRHLKPGGLFVQWVQAYEINDELVATIGNTLTQSFRDYRVFQANEGDLIFVARADGDIGDFDPTVLEEPALHDQLKRLAITTADDLRFREVGDRRSLAPLFGALSRRTNSDFYPILSLEAPRSRFRKERATTLSLFSTADLPVIEMIAGIPAADATPTKSVPRGAALARAKDIANAIRGRDAGDGASASGLAMLHAIGACGDVSPTAAGTALMEFGAATIPYLSAEALRGVWIDPAWQRCDHAAPAIGDLLGVLAALSARDAAGAGARALETLSRHGEELSNETKDYLVRAAMLSALAEGHPEKVSEIAEGPGASIPPRHATLMQYVYLRAIAEAAQHTGREPAAAQASR